MSSQLSPSGLPGRRRGSSSVVALPTRRAGELNEEFLVRVDARMAEVVDDLERVWTDELSPHGAVVDILADRDLPEHAELARDLCLKDHADADALAVEHVWGQDGLDGVANGVPEVDEVTEPGGLALVMGHDVGLDGDGADNDGE